MKYKVGDKVRIKSLDWYNQNKGKDNNVPLIKSTNSYYNFIEVMRRLCGKVMTISSVNNYYYDMVEDYGDYFWTDEMIEGLAEDLLDKEIQEHQKICNEALTIKGIEPTEEVWHCPEGYQFKDENGNVINATKIVLTKKKSKYPKTYEECCKVLDWNHRDYDRVGYEAELLCKFQVLLLCRDAYWKIAGEEMGLGRPWEYGCRSEYFTPAIIYRNGFIQKVEIQYRNAILTFPTEEMRDAFYENFEKLIEQCKELL